MVVVPYVTGGWFDLWHVHPNDAVTPDRWANLIVTWSRVDLAGRDSGRPWQSWLLIVPDSPRDDAVYLHTANPNCDNFPYKFEGVDWGAEPPAWAATGMGLQFGRSECGSHDQVWVRRPQRDELDGGDGGRAGLL